MKTANATAKFNLTKTVVTRFTRPAAGRAKGMTDTSVITISNILLTSGH